MKVLIDTGAQHSFINEKCLKSIDQFKYSDIQHQKFFLADGLTSFIVTGTVHLNIHICDVITTISAFITENLCTTLILGMDYLLKYDLEIQPKKKSILFNFSDRKIMIPIDTETTPIDSLEKLSNSIKLTLDSDPHYFPDNDNPAFQSSNPPSSFDTITSPSSFDTITSPSSFDTITSPSSFDTITSPSSFDTITSPSSFDTITSPSSFDTITSPSSFDTITSPSSFDTITSPSSFDTITSPSSFDTITSPSSFDTITSPSSFDTITSPSSFDTITSPSSFDTITSPSSFNRIQQAISNLLHHILHEVQRDRIQSLLFRFESSFDTSKYTIAHTQLSHVIETYPHTPPVTKCYPSNPTSISEMRLIINKLLEAGLVRHSQSSYAAPALLIKKKDQTWRLVIDYKKLNAITIKDNYPLPNMEVTLQTLGAGYCYFTKLDLKSGFWQLPIDEKDRYKTAFTTPFGLFEWLVLPQGLRNAPPSFQRIMNNILGAYSEFCLVYLDDIVIFSHDFNQHLFHLEQILNALQSHNLILTSTKCEIAKQKIEYLGHIISSTTISPLPEKIKSIISLPEPKSLAQANRFIGGLSWYRKFLPQFASVAAPIHAITNLSKSNRYKFKWGPEQSKSFYALKQLLTSTPLFLHFPDDTHPVLLSTDASQVGLGGILYQDIDDVRRILYYHSELLSSSQKRFHPIELEALAIFKCITRMKSFLLGRIIIIYTDNCPLCHMMDKKISNKRVEKISLLLQEFNIQQIIHVKGQYNCLPDYLSRHPISYDDELLDSEYGLGFTKDKSSSIQLLGAVVTRSKSKAIPHDVIPPPSSSKQQSSLDSPPSSTIQQQQPSSLNSSSPSSNDLRHHQHIHEHFDITTLQEHQQNDSRIQQIINDLQEHPNISFDYQDGILYKLLSNPHAPIKRKLIYVPNSMIKSLLFSYHDNPLIGGHFAVRRTLEKLKQKILVARYETTYY